MWGYPDRDTSSTNANINAATQICHTDTSSANTNINAATQICHRDTSFANAHITAATQICHRDTSFANANITAATQICHRDTSSANVNIIAATPICHRDKSCANAHILTRQHRSVAETPPLQTLTAAARISHRDTSSANANVTAATSQPRPRRRQSAPQLLQKRCVLRLPHTEQPRPRRRQSAPQLLQEALCTAPATQQLAAATTAPIRAAAPSGGVVYCACHTKSSRGHGGANPRHSSFRRLCVLRLPRNN